MIVIILRSGKGAGPALEEGPGGRRCQVVSRCERSVTGPGVSRVKYSVATMSRRVSCGSQAGENPGQGPLAGGLAAVGEDRGPFPLQPGGDVDGRGGVRVRDREHAFADRFQQGAEAADAGLGVRGAVQGAWLPGRTGLRVQAGEPGVLNGEECDLVGATVVRVAGQLSEGVVRDHDVGAERADPVDQGGDDLFHGRVDEPGPVVGRPRGAGVAVPQHAGRARAECVQSVGELGGPWAVRCPRHGDHTGARLRGGVLGEYAAGEEALVVGMGEHAQEGRESGIRHGRASLSAAATAGETGPGTGVSPPGQRKTSRAEGLSSTWPGGSSPSGVRAGWTVMGG